MRGTKLREKTGINIIGVWEQGRLEPARPELEITNSSVCVVMGPKEELKKLDKTLARYDKNPNPVLIIGGGSVGAAAAQALASKDVPVNLLEENQVRCSQLQGICNRIIEGDAADIQHLKEAGIDKAPSVLITTNDDAVNVYLTAYCRRLNPEIRIVSRITHERNLDSIYRAGADFVLSYSTLGLDAIMAILNGKELIVLGEGVDLFSRKLPKSLHGKTLAQSGIGALTGMTVVAIKTNDEVISHLNPSMVLEDGMELLLIGSMEQIEVFVQSFERTK